MMDSRREYNNDGPLIGYDNGEPLAGYDNGEPPAVV